MRNRFFFVFFLALAACRPAPQPTPQPTVPPLNLTVAAYNAYFPVVRAFGDCEVSEKAGIALAHSIRGLPKGLLCLPDDVSYHTWGIVGGQTEIGSKVSVVWADDKSGYDYVRAFDNYVDGRDLTDVVLFGNEPDRPDQADMTTEEVALLFLRLVEICPNCRFVGPMYSTADDGQKVAEVWATVGELCGMPCPAMESLYAHSLHIYPRPEVNLPPSMRVDRLCELVDGGDCLRRVWVTEMGWRTCWPGVGERFGEWVEDAEGDSRIEKYFVYTTYQEEGEGCRFNGLLVWDAWPDYELDEMGRAFRGVFVAPPQ